MQRNSPPSSLLRIQEINQTRGNFAQTNDDLGGRRRRRRRRRGTRGRGAINHWSDARWGCRLRRTPFKWNRDAALHEAEIRCTREHTAVQLWKVLEKCPQNIWYFKKFQYNVTNFDQIICPICESIKPNWHFTSSGRDMGAPHLDLMENVLMKML